MQISKTEAFNLVAKALEDNDEKSANDMLQIISRSISRTTNIANFSPYIEVKGKKEIKTLQNTISKYPQQQKKEQDS